MFFKIKCNFSSLCRFCYVSSRVSGSDRRRCVVTVATLMSHRKQVHWTTSFLSLCICFLELLQRKASVICTVYLQNAESACSCRRTGPECRTDTCTLVARARSSFNSWCQLKLQKLLFSWSWKCVSCEHACLLVGTFRRLWL